MPEIWFPNLGIEIKHLSRTAFSIFGFDVYWYGIFITFSIFLGMLLCMKQVEKTGQNKDLYFDFVFVAIIFALIGARTYFIIFSWDTYKNDILSIFNIRNGGLAIYGGVIAAVITAIVYTKRKKIDFFLFADTCIPYLVLGQAIGRFGNFVNREVFGGFTETIFAMRYLSSQVEEIPDSVLEKVVYVNGSEYIQVHPTFLYESVWNFVLFGILILFRKNNMFKGELLAIYFIGYGLGRAWIEGIRTDQLKFFNSTVPVSQVLSIILIFVGIIYIILNRLYLKKRKINSEIN